MRTSAKTIGCPPCGLPATLTVFEELDPATGVLGKRDVFACADAGHQLDEPAASALWSPSQAPEAVWQRAAARYAATVRGIDTA